MSARILVCQKLWSPLLNRGTIPIINISIPGRAKNTELINYYYCYTTTVFLFQKLHCWIHGRTIDYCDSTVLVPVCCMPHQNLIACNDLHFSTEFTTIFIIRVVRHQFGRRFGPTWKGAPFKFVWFQQSTQRQTIVVHCFDLTP